MEARCIIKRKEKMRLRLIAPADLWGVQSAGAQLLSRSFKTSCDGGPPGLQRHDYS